MPCLIGILAFFFPRLTIVLVVLFSDYIGKAFETTIWPFLGFLFMPLTVLAYALAKNANGTVEGGYLALVVVAALFDLGIIGGNAKLGHSRTK